jgi:UDP-GlcNAc:undecaprenyl-phosphate GlcNAc-1-phosphate transferase
MDERSFFVNLFLTTLAALIFSRLAVLLAVRLRLMDTPGSAPHKQHHQAVPLAGGITVFLTLFCMTLVSGLFDSPLVQKILLTASIVFLAGLVDDKFDLPPLAKLFCQIVAAVALVLSGVQIHILINEPLNIILSIVWLVGITNAFNFVDSMDGLLVGLSCITAACLMYVTNGFGQENLALLSLFLFGACLVAFYFNSFPALLFMGDSGAQFLGFLFGALVMAFDPAGYSPLSSWALPILMLGVPIFDTCLVVFSRLRRHVPIYRSSLDHTYHRLVRMGVSRNRAILSLQAVTLVLDCLALIALYQTPLNSNLIFGGVFLFGLISFGILEWSFVQRERHITI